jgi:hypothetical protein
MPLRRHATLRASASASPKQSRAFAGGKALRSRLAVKNPYPIVGKRPRTPSTGTPRRGSSHSSFPYGNNGIDVGQWPPARYRSPGRHVLGNGEGPIFISLDKTGLRRLCPAGRATIVAGNSDSLQRELKIDSTESVTFTQVSAQAGMHRDAVMFANGRTLLLQRMHEGQRVEVLSLCSHDAVNSLRDRFGDAESKSAAMVV